MKAYRTAIITLALSSSMAFAADKPQTVNVATAVTIGSAHLNTGDCKVSWTGAGPEVQVTLVGHNAAPITVPATLVQEKHDRSSITTISHGSDVALSSVELKNVTLKIKDETAQTAQAQ